MSYNQWDILLVPFPFTDLSSQKKRPALVVSHDKYNAEGDVIIGFITSQLSGNPKIGDYLIEEWEEAGLPKPSKIRMKLATLSDEIVIKKIGKMTPKDVTYFHEVLKDFFISG
ncbi:type II toxin-antitoxin system PemK/MazF family toxin [Ekhidna sp.]|uniref:type II toxin-antitoxin system PemK/MazF family toxin n=1 Tax=Ekhidna sp. TaxID=2608089 RepID=UPI003CCBB349